MNIELIKKYRDHLPKAVLVLVIVVTLLTAGRIFAFAVAVYRIPAQIQGAIDNCHYDEEMVGKSLARYKDAADSLKKKSLFVAPSVSVAKLPVCTAILGNKALINGKYFGVGDTIAGAEILSIDGFDVTVKWEDKEVKLVPFAVSNLTPEQKKGPAPKKQDGGEQPKPQVAQQAEGRPMPGMGGGSSRRGDRGDRGGFSSEERQQMMEKYQKMSPDEQRQFREEQMKRFRNR